MFAGVDERELQQLHGEQAMILKGQMSVRQDCSNFPIDFNAVVKGYL
jgi:hypothetical protein